MLKLKVTQINKYYPPWLGGVESHVKDLSEGLLDTQKIDVSVLCCHCRFSRLDEVVEGIPVKRSPTLLRLKSIPLSLHFIWDLGQLKSDVLHFHLPNPLAVLAYFIMRPKGKVVVTWHSDIIKQKIILKVYKYLLNWFLGKADLIITTSQNLLNCSSFLPKFRDKVKVVPLGIRESDYEISEKTSQLKQVVQQTHSKYILFVGRLVYYKGITVLLEAIAGTPCKLIIIGEGPLKSEIESFCDQKLQAGQVLILPPQEKASLIAYFRDCAFFVFPSTHNSEAFGIVQLEAMIQEKAVISTKLPTGVSFVNSDDETGVLVEPNDVSDLKCAILRLWNDESLCDAFGKNGKARVLSLFTHKKMISGVMTGYEGLFLNRSDV